MKHFDKIYLNKSNSLNGVLSIIGVYVNYNFIGLRIEYRKDNIFKNKFTYKNVEFKVGDENI